VVTQSNSLPFSIRSVFLNVFALVAAGKGINYFFGGFFQILKGSFLFSFLFVSWCVLVPWLMPKGRDVETQSNSVMPSIRSVFFSVVIIMTAGKSVKDICAGFVKVMYGVFWCVTAVLAWKGIKDIFAGLIKILNALVEIHLNAVEGNVSLAPGELHAKKIVIQDGTYQNYAYMGLGTRLEERGAEQIEPINGLDTAARDHDIVYTQFQQRLKNGETVTIQEVQEVDQKFILQVLLSKHDDMMNALAVALFFSAKKHAEDMGLFSHIVFVV